MHGALICGRTPFQTTFIFCWALYYTVNTNFVELILFQDPFGENQGVFDYSSIKLRLDAIKRNIDAEKAAAGELDDTESDEEEASKPAVAENPPPEIDDWEEFLYGDD